VSERSLEVVVDTDGVAAAVDANGEAAGGAKAGVSFERTLAADAVATTLRGSATAFVGIARRASDRRIAIRHGGRIRIGTGNATATEQQE